MATFSGLRTGVLAFVLLLAPLAARGESWVDNEMVRPGGAQDRARLARVGPELPPYLSCHESPAYEYSCFEQVSGSGLKGDVSSKLKTIEFEKADELAGDAAAEEAAEFRCRANLMHYYPDAESVCFSNGGIPYSDKQLDAWKKVENRWATGERGSYKNPDTQEGTTKGLYGRTHDLCVNDKAGMKALYEDMARPRADRKNKRASCQFWHQTVLGWKDLPPARTVEFDPSDNNKDIGQRAVKIMDDITRSVARDAETDLGYFEAEKQLEFLVSNAAARDPSFLEDDAKFRDAVQQIAGGAGSCVLAYGNKSAPVNVWDRLDRLRSGLRSSPMVKARESSYLDQVAMARKVKELKDSMTGLDSDHREGCEADDDKKACSGIMKIEAVCILERQEKRKNSQSGPCAFYLRYRTQLRSILTRYPVLNMTIESTPMSKLPKNAWDSIKALYDDAAVRKKPLYEALLDPSMGRRAFNWASLMVQSRGTATLKDACDPKAGGLAAQGRKALSNPKLLGNYLSCHDLAFSRDCRDRRSMAWALCYDYGLVQHDKLEDEMWQSFKEVALVGTGVALTVMSAGLVGPEFVEGAELAASIITGVEIGKDVKERLTYDADEALKQGYRTELDYQMGWTSREEYLKKMKSYEQEGAGSFAARNLMRVWAIRSSKKSLQRRMELGKENEAEFIKKLEEEQERWFAKADTLGRATKEGQAAVLTGMEIGDHIRQYKADLDKVSTVLAAMEEGGHLNELRKLVSKEGPEAVKLFTKLIRGEEVEVDGQKVKFDEKDLDLLFRFIGEDQT